MTILKMKVPKTEDDSLAQIEQEVRFCIKCPLYRTRLNAVVGHFPPNAEKILFVKDGPSNSDDVTGLPLTGRTGSYFSNLVYDRLGLTREQYNISHCVKCIPLNDKMRVYPKKRSVFWCAEYLYRQIDIIQPKLVVSMGFVPFFVFIHKVNESFSWSGRVNMRPYNGKLFETQSMFSDHKFYVYQTYDPEMLLRSIKTRKMLETDFDKLKDIWNAIRKDESVQDFLTDGSSI